MCSANASTVVHLSLFVIFRLSNAEVHIPMLEKVKIITNSHTPRNLPMLISADAGHRVGIGVPGRRSAYPRRAR
jgi:hypothetical protein